ncbi:unnamed protein product [Heligmosomoides polygyrus]|uniref:Peptidase_M14 domain-containing protein n=1 Tax=Heligmosomoides polygyrus TaxID=6339 RepID=A0A183GWP3_HELPZ|nr:unnamed protein product [Heligmosomoides polygyrus]
MVQFPVVDLHSDVFLFYFADDVFEGGIEKLWGYGILLLNPSFHVDDDFVAEW